MKSRKQLFLIFPVLILAGCADSEVDPSRPAVQHKTLTERMNDGGGYKQNEEGQWVPKSDKRSSYDSQRDSPYFKGKVEKDTYKTGDYAKKSWLGGKDYARKSYEGNTDGSRFRKQSLQEGKAFGTMGKKVRPKEAYVTKTLERTGAREAGVGGVDRPLDAAIKSQRGTYKAPSVIDWREQRQMGMDESRGILGR